MSHPKMFDVVKDYEKKRSKTTRIRLGRKLVKQGSIPWDPLPFFYLQLKLDHPGPMALFFFEKGIMELRRKASGCRYRCRFFLCEFEDFMLAMNPVLVEKKGEALPRGMRDVEMVWYYGIPDKERGTAITEFDDIYKD